MLRKRTFAGVGINIFAYKGTFFMLLWAIRQVNFKEFLGQALPIIGAATKTAIGLFPSGNDGGSNVSPFKVLPVSPEFAAIIAKANQSSRGN